MRFTQKTSFNSHDTKLVQTTDGRITVVQKRGMKARCELTLNALLRFGAKGGTVAQLAEHLNRRLKANYSTSDIRRACERLVRARLVVGSVATNGKACTYHATAKALDSWRKMFKSARQAAK